MMRDMIFVFSGEYVETQFNIVDDRALKSRFFFESTRMYMHFAFINISGYCMH